MAKWDCEVYTLEKSLSSDISILANLVCAKTRKFVVYKWDHILELRAGKKVETDYTLFL